MAVYTETKTYHTKAHMGMIDVTEDYRNRCIMVMGQFRSYNRHEEQRNRLVLSVFAREIEFVEEEPDGARTNHILLE